MNKKAGLNSVLVKSLYGNLARIQNCLLSITNRCEDCTLATFCETQDDFSELLTNLSGSAIELIQDSFISTPFTRLITSTVWHKELSMVTFKMARSIVTQEDCDKQIENLLIA